MTIRRKTGHVSSNLRQRLRTSLSKTVCFPVGISDSVSARVKSGGLLVVRSCLSVPPGRYPELRRSYVMCFPVGSVTHKVPCALIMVRFTVCFPVGLP